MQGKPEIRDKLPVHPAQDEKGVPPHVLRVDGLVGRSLELTMADLERLPQQDLIDDFTCLEGWTVPRIQWRGVALETVLSLAKPRAEARYVEAGAGEFRVTLRREDAKRALIALRMGDSAVPREHGGPLRLVVPGGECFTSIKWLDHLELRSEPGENSGEKAARRRLACQQTRDK
jgi:DMSO/TMAO reductase YedYZ molybdopterin-dependent catalytic subunit